MSPMKSIVEAFRPSCGNRAAYLAKYVDEGRPYNILSCGPFKLILGILSRHE